MAMHGIKISEVDWATYYVLQLFVSTQHGHSNHNRTTSNISDGQQLEKARFQRLFVVLVEICNGNVLYQ